MTTPRDIDDARARLLKAGAALRERPREETVASLARVLDAWSRPDSPWQKRLVETLPAASGFTPENLRAGLAAGLRDWTGAALRALVAAELPSKGSTQTTRNVLATGFESTSVVLAGSIPMPTLVSLVAPLVLHSPVLAKTASRDSVTAHVFRESLLEVDPALAGALEVVSFSGADEACMAAFVDAPCIVATGSDETVASIARSAPPGARCVAYGHRVSVAVLGPGALTRDCANAVARDASLWDQLGCLSPVAVFAVGSSTKAVDDFAEELARAFASAELHTPRGEISTTAAATIRMERDAAEMRSAAGSATSGDVVVHSDKALRWVVVREADAAHRVAPLHRFLRVHPVSDLAGLETALRPLSRHLAGVALAGFGSADDDVARALAGLGASRSCEPGTLQTPPLGWHHDNQPVLLPLARLTDLESNREVAR